MCAVLLLVGECDIEMVSRFRDFEIPIPPPVPVCVCFLIEDVVIRQSVSHSQSVGFANVG